MSNEKNRIITISREYGSGGRMIGQQLAERLGIPCHDQEIIAKIAKETGLLEEYVKATAEYSEYPGWLSGAFMPHDRGGRSLQGDLWAMQRRIIIDLAKKGPCVIVGRCADFILKDQADLLRVFIYADLDIRAERIVKEYGEKSDKPEKLAKSKDSHRAAFYNFQTGLKWGDPNNFDLCLNSGSLGIEKCVDILQKMY